MTAQRTSPLKRIFILSSLLLVAVTTAAHARTDEPYVGEPAIGEPRLSTSTINGATNTSHYPPIPIDKRLNRSEATPETELFSTIITVYESLIFQ